MSERTVAQELALALLAGVATWLGVKLAQRLEDPYSEPRLSVGAWFNHPGGGDPT